MPLCSSINCKHARQYNAGAPLSAFPLSSPSRCLTIGLINNMPDAALEATERQFRSLLASASDGVTVRLSLYALPEVPRTPSGQRHIEDFYSSVDDLWKTRLDGLIVTGAEPRMARLTDEPYWDSFTRVLEWARNHTHSTIFSCLAAHAAILYLDGIGRIKSDAKHFGLFDCERVSNHPLMAGTALRFKVPHSRWNGVAEEQLTAAGYNLLTRSADAGIDTFVKRQRALLVFFQGHPEYEADTLLREYRRDVGRYLKAEIETYPSVPRDYFAQDTADALAALREQAISGRAGDLSANVSIALDQRAIENSWHTTAVSIYRNWLHYIREEKENEGRLNPIDGVAQPPGAGASSQALFSITHRA